MKTSSASAPWPARDEDVTVSDRKLLSLAERRIDEYEPEDLDCTVSVKKVLNGVVAGVACRTAGRNQSILRVEFMSSIEVFYSYSHKDEGLRDELNKHLSLLKRQGIIRDWHDRRITGGTEWAGQIDKHLNSAGVILLLVSADFLASDYCYDVELKRAMERHEAGEAAVIPVILRAVDWHGAPFGKLQGLPKDARPVTSWDNQDEAFTDIAKGIRKAVEEPAKPRVGSSEPAGATPVSRPIIAQEIVPFSPTNRFRDTLSIAAKLERLADLIEAAGISEQVRRTTDDAFAELAELYAEVAVDDRPMTQAEVENRSNREGVKYNGGSIAKRKEHQSLEQKELHALASTGMRILRELNERADPKQVSSQLRKIAVELKKRYRSSETAKCGNDH